LLVVDRPDEAPNSNTEQYETQRDQDEEDAHAGARTSHSRSALPTTSRELSDMPIAAA
jgi:hypothetical protein